jgi:hypothetical protein
VIGGLNERCGGALNGDRNLGVFKFGTSVGGFGGEAVFLFLHSSQDGFHVGLGLAGGDGDSLFALALGHQLQQFVTLDALFDLAVVLVLFGVQRRLALGIFLGLLQLAQQFLVVGLQALRGIFNRLGDAGFDIIGVRIPLAVLGVGTSSTVAIPGT